MAGFIRFFSNFPSVAEITEISGSFIIDVPPPVLPPVAGFGKTIMVGEFADMTFATDVDLSNGHISTRLQPVQIFSSQDLIDKVGGFDPSLGDFGASMGNGFVALRNKRFNGGLIVVPLNLSSDRGARLVRELPTNLSSTDPSPVVPMQQAVVLSGSEFLTGSDRVHLAKSAFFSDASAYLTAIDGVTTASVGSVSAFDLASASADFSSVNVGDIVVLGVIGEAGALGANAGTYRVISVDSVAGVIGVQTLDGASSIAVQAGTAQPFRIHPAATADSGIGLFSDEEAYLLPVRPLDAAVAASASLLPVVQAAAGSATFWEPFSGLKMLSHPDGGFAYDAAVQGPNAASSASLDALYKAAIQATMTEDLPVGGSSFILCARTSLEIRKALAEHVQLAQNNGMLRMTSISPEVNITSLASVLGNADPGVGANRSDRVVYNWPAARTLIPEAVGVPLLGSDGANHSDGILDVPTDAWAISVMASLPQERDPGQSAEPVRTVLSPIIGLQRNAPPLGLAEHKLMKKAGIMALRIDRTVGPVFQEGITTSLVEGRIDINRRRFADFVEISLAEIYNLYAKQPLTETLKDALVAETTAFLAGLLSSTNPALSRISAYQIDPDNGNTPDREAQGIYVIISKVKMFPIAKFIGVQAEVGPNVIIQTSL